MERFNRSFLINKAGEIQYIYTKQCLFWKEKELAKASPGRENRVINTDFGNIGILQCCDIYSPQRLDLARPLVENAPLIIAKELGVYVAVCDTYRPIPENADPSDLENEYSLCYSRIVNPERKVISSIRDKEGIIFSGIEI